jgi:hypothetical protein
LIGACGFARADVIELRNGGRIHGDVVEGADGAGATYVISVVDGGRVSVPRSEVSRVVSQTAAETEYARRDRAAANSVAAHVKLAEWCRAQGMRDEYREQMARILELDPNHEPARRALGFQNKNGQWLQRDDVMAARGLVLYDGKYHTRQHVELLEQAKQAKLTGADWKNQLKRWRRWLTGRNASRSAEAQQAIAAIGDPEAAPAVADMLLAEEDAAVRRLLVDVAARLDHPQTINALVEISLNDPDHDTRLDCLELLIQMERPGLVVPYARALKSADNEMVNRAAESLEMIGSRDALGPLINALVTKHTVMVGSGPSQDTYAFTPSGGTAMNFGGGKPKAVSQPFENPTVLAALNKLSGVNFGYDKAAWRAWLAAEVKANPVDVRRDL